MAWLIGWPLAVFLVTAIAARVVVARQPAASYTKQVFWAALAFPALAGILFVLATVVTLAGASKAGDAGMPIFAFVFFLIYALMGAAVIGLPSAFLTVRLFRRR